MVPVMDYAFRALARRPLSEAELKRKLVRRGYEAAQIDECLSRLAEMGYVDDGRFARDYVQARLLSRPSGKRRLVAELTARGVPNVIAEREVEAALSGDYERALAMEVAKKRLAFLARSGSSNATRRLYQYLLRRGFDSDLVRDVLDELVAMEQRGF